MKVKRVRPYTFTRTTGGFTHPKNLRIKHNMLLHNIDLAVNRFNIIAREYLYSFIETSPAHSTDSRSPQTTIQKSAYHVLHKLSSKMLYKDSGSNSFINRNARTRTPEVQNPELLPALPTHYLPLQATTQKSAYHPFINPLQRASESNKFINRSARTRTLRLKNFDLLSQLTIQTTI